MRYTNHVGVGVLDSPLFSPIELTKNITTMYPKKKFDIKDTKNHRVTHSSGTPRASSPTVQNLR